MLRILIINSKHVEQAVTTGPNSVGDTFLEGQQLNSVCFDTATHEVSYVTCHLATKQVGGAICSEQTWTFRWVVPCKCMASWL